MFNLDLNKVGFYHTKKKGGVDEISRPAISWSFPLRTGYPSIEAIPTPAAMFSSIQTQPRQHHPDT